ncbi:MAG: lipoyl(octanoyl) transferase LipB [Holosporales bacterium]
MSHQGTSKPEWRLSSSSDPVDYAEALQAMEVRVQGIQNASASELVWLLEHPPLYTLGTSANATDVLDSALPTYTTGRGGKVTYHGPGQRVAYLMLDLNQRSKDLRAYVHALEAWLILTLRHFDIKAERRLGRIGLWVTAAGEERKIAAIGVRVQKWVTSHGIALNVSPNLRHFQGIVPCGLANYGVTSMHDLGIPCAMDHVDAVLRQTFEKIF